MKTVADERLIYEILSVVEEISCGKVASYVQIARLIGREKTPVLWAECLNIPTVSANIPVTVSLTASAGLPPDF